MSYVKGLEKVTKTELNRRLSELGYCIDEKSSFNYQNSYNPGESWPARSCYIVEKDTGLGFSNIHARKDANFEKLQEMRRQGGFNVNGRIYEL